MLGIAARPCNGGVVGDHSHAEVLVKVGYELAVGVGVEVVGLRGRI